MLSHTAIYGRSRAFCRALALICVVLVSACKVDLYTNKSEREGNEMAAILARAGIPVTRERNKDGTINLFVEEARFAEAVDILSANGLPEQQFSNLGDMFSEDSLVNSPTQERARFIHALSEQLSETISQIDGVLRARLHIVLPQNDPLRRDIKPSSASVFISYRSDAAIDQIVPQIKLLVANGIEGLVYDKVSVALVPVDVAMPDIQTDMLVDVAGIWTHRESAPRLRWVLYIATGLVFLVIGLVIALIWLAIKRENQTNDRDGSDNNVRQLART